MYWVHAANLASVGLHDEAVEELRTMLSRPGTVRFPFIEAFAAFDDLRDHPGYLELRKQYGLPQT